MAFEAFQLVGTISVDIIPAAQYVLLNLLFLMYAFASLGTALYGGSKFFNSKISYYTKLRCNFPNIFLLCLK